MQSASKEAPEPTGTGISEDFLTGSAPIGLERIRTRLLDLTNRNKLLNFKPSKASSLRIVGAPINPVFTRLRDGEKIPFAPVPEPGRRIGETLPAKDYAEQLGWDTSFDLDDADPDTGGRSLPVLLYPEALDTLGRKIASAAKTAIEESGTNMLYLVFGLLEWYESDDSSQLHHAPLVVLPVTLERGRSKARAVEVIVEYSGDDIETNLSLAEKMRRDFGLEIPAWEDEHTPEDYFEQFAEILKLKKRWTIRRQVTLALLSFGKLLMYRDLDPKNWPTEESIAGHPLVRELFEGSKNSTIERAEEYAIDGPDLRKYVPDLILDADSSQHSALIHALRGYNLVIEGPPGTGKSQTITNLIAAALAKGKTVLFVSEKLAALEVVRSRLDGVGLGVFCLEVHSHKTKKGALINDIAQRASMRGTFSDPRDLDLHLSVVEDKKRLLTQYVSLINKIIEPFSATIFDVLWARDNFGQQILAHRDRLAQLTLPTVTQYSRSDYTEREQALSLFARHLSIVLASSHSLDHHPWAWITQPLSFSDEENVLRFLENFRAAIREAEGCCQSLKTLYGISIDRCVRGLEAASQMLSVLPDPDSSLLDDLLASCLDANTRLMLSVFVGHVTDYQSLVQRLSGSTSNVSALFDQQNNTELLGAFECLRQWGLDGHSVAEVKQVSALCNKILKQLTDAHSSFQALLQVIGCEARATLTNTSHLLETIRIIETSPLDRLHLRNPVFEEEHTRPLVETAREEAAILKTAAFSLEQEFDLSLGSGMHTPAQLFKVAASLDEASFWQRLVGSEYKRAVKTYSRIAGRGKKADRAHMSRSLRSVAEYTQSRLRFDNHQHYRQTLGVHFQGVDSDWDGLHKLILWYEEVFVGLPEHHSSSEPFRRLLLNARIDRLKGIKAQRTPTQPHRDILSQIVGHLTEFTRSVPSLQPLIASGSFDEILADLRRLNHDLNDVLYTVKQAAIHDKVQLRTVPDLLSLADQCRNSVAAVQSANETSGLLGEVDRGLNTDVGPIKRTLEFAESIIAIGLPARAVQSLLCREHKSRVTGLRDLLQSAVGSADKIDESTREVTTLSGSDLWTASPENPWISLDALAESALAQRQDLNDWQHFLRLQINNRQSGLERLTSLAETGILEPQELVPAFRFVFHNTLARNIFSSEVELTEATGVTQDLLRQQFAKADKQAIRLYGARVGALIDKRPVPSGNRSGPVGRWTEMALISNEANKQKRHIPIRQLILRSANALLALKPCFMMGPLAVAQYLVPGKVKFDLVVMDEASQLRPEDAIGALARGGQVVIVGDPKQLPPTSFFQRVAIDSEEDVNDEDRSFVEEGESILDVAATLFQPVRQLRWHYRSRHQSLIAFSNQEFYDGNLIIFPSAYNRDDSLGVKYHFIRDGVLENRRNPIEAEAVANAVLEHMRTHPYESIGVVTLNFEQKELIEDLLDRQTRDDPAALAFQERMTSSQGSLFVKNLENVQGDERDVIFISTTYGPDSGGNQYQRFGPINGPTGHRRLNVLFTRAKKRTEVFSSLDPDKINTTDNSPWGVRALKKYLIYARSGVLQQPDSGNDQPTNDFERSVGSVLRENGYEVVPQVGVAGFFLDLGVKHPHKAGAYLLGIECDGASYHSGRSARDRDRLRQEILENLGWKIHRVWSTDWFRSRDSEIKRLLNHVAELVGQAN